MIVQKIPHKVTDYYFPPFCKPEYVTCRLVCPGASFDQKCARFIFNAPADFERCVEFSHSAWCATKKKEWVQTVASYGAWQRGQIDDAALVDIVGEYAISSLVHGSVDFRYVKGGDKIDFMLPSLKNPGTILTFDIKNSDKLNRYGLLVKTRTRTPWCDYYVHSYIENHDTWKKTKEVSIIVTGYVPVAKVKAVPPTLTPKNRDNPDATWMNHAVSYAALTPIKHLIDYAQKVHDMGLSVELPL